MEKSYAIEVEHLVKSYGDVRAVDDVSFKVEKGSLFAFLGVNGAGKSTTINIICSILDKNSGKIVVDGYDIDQSPYEIKREIGIVFQTSVLDKELTVKQNLELRTAFYALTKQERKQNVADIIELLELKPILNQSVRTLSGGQLRRVDIARAMVHKPKLLILDEPTTGLDPKTRLNVWAMIDKIRKETGMTVFLTTHYLEEAERATDVVIMDKGHVIAHGTPIELKNEYSTDSLFCYSQQNAELEAQLEKSGYKYVYDGEREAYKITVEGTAGAKKLLAECGGLITDMEIIKGNMDDVFLNVTGKDIKIMGDGDENE